MYWFLGIWMEKVEMRGEERRGEEWERGEDGLV